MKKQLLLLTILLLIALSTPLIAQGVGINSSGAAADDSAVLDVSSNTQGTLLTRMTASERLGIASPATGLLVFQTDGVIGFYFYAGSGWLKMTDEATNSTLTTTAVSNITSSTASSGGTIIDDGGVAITESGVCWGTSTNPTTSGSHTTEGGASGSFTSNISGLAAGTLYYVRAYVTNTSGTSYGNEVSFTTAINVGDSYGGGIVFYVDGTGGGLISSTSDQSTGIVWMEHSTAETRAYDQSVGAGQTNTTTIVSHPDAGSCAAQLCNDFVSGIYSDWFLPSLDELALMYTNRAAIGGFDPSAFYWSSSESGVNPWKAFSLDLGGTGSYEAEKGSIYPNVRAIRAF